METEKKYKPVLLEWLEEMFEHAKQKQWYETYHAFDVHGVISRPDYRKTETIGQEFTINYYPYAKETLQFLTKNRPDMILFLFTSSYPDEIDKYMEQFEKDGIHFKFVNENPDISDAKGSFGCYDKKPYWNSIWEDKAGFKPEIDWLPFYNYFYYSSYKPDPSWSFKTDENYHEKIKPTKFSDLTDEQLIEFAKLRLINKRDGEYNNYVILDNIKIEDRWNTINHEFGVSFIIQSKEWSPYRESIIFNKFHINEIVYLIKCGIKFEKL